jgi:H+-transporting ATPase
MIINLFTCNKTEAIETQLKSDLEEFVICGLCALAVAYEELNGDDPKAEGSRFEFIGLLCILQSSLYLPCLLVCHCIHWLS